MDSTTAENPGLKYTKEFESMLSSEYHKKRATSFSGVIDCILHNAHFFVLFSVYLVCRFVNHISLYQVLFCACLTPFFLYFYINYAPFLFLEEDIKWIQREVRLLHAISEDAKKVMELSSYISERARQIWGSGPYPDGITVKGLDETEAEWLEKAKSTVLKAQDLIATFQRERITRDSHTQRTVRFDMMTSTTEKFQQVQELFIETNLVKEKMKDAIEMMGENGISIGESLERSRSEIICLLDRAVYEHGQEKWMDAQERLASAAALSSTVAENIKCLKTQNPSLMRGTTGEKILSINLQMGLLHQFMKDIKGILFESEIENAWVKKVLEIIDEAHLAIENFLQSPGNRLRWLSFITGWKARRKLKADIRSIEIGFTQLLERKETYGFKFIRRDSSKLVFHQSPHQSTDEATISYVLKGMHFYLDERPDLVGKVFYEVKSLCDQLESMQKLVHDAAAIEGRYSSRMAWLKQTSEIAESAKEAVVTFLKNSRTVWVKNLFRTGAETKLSRDIDRIKHTIDLFLRCIKGYGIESREESSSVVGLEEDIEAVVSQLTANNEDRSVISIVGIGGVGKTTLARKIYNHRVVAHHFPYRAWVSVPPHESNDNALLEDVAKQILRSLRLQEEDNCNASWIQKVHNVLKDRRYLLVLDNISTLEELNTLKAEFLVTSCGCRILLTTHDNDVALQTESPPLKLRLRTKEESWQLFTQMVHVLPTEELLAQEILGKCGGLPQAILRVGYLLSGKDVRTAEELKMVIEYIVSNATPLLETFTIRLINFDHLFKCLSYLKLFPGDFEVPARRLTALWIAEGLVQVSEPTTETYEDVACKYLSQLIDQDMIQVVERKHNGEVKTCRLPHALQKLELQDMSSNRLIDHYHRRRDPRLDHIHGKNSNLPNEYRHLLSFLSFDTREGNKPGEEIGNFLRRGIAGGFFHLLQALDLERVFRPELPNTIGKLSKLRYLGLRWTFLEKIPSSIGDLPNLQTLDVKHTYIHALPSSIWKLQKLRHLYLNQSYRSKFMHQQGGSSLKDLQTLWGLFVDKDSPLKNRLEKLINLRKLGLAFQLTESEQKVLAEKIVKLNHLKSLRVKSINDMGEPFDLFLMPLLCLEKLSSLNLSGVLKTPSILAEFPQNLTDLTLSASFLSADPMPKLEKLPNLKFLFFYSNSYVGIDMACSTLGFPKLVVLKLWKLEQLEDWNVEEKAIQNLRELEIRSCTRLKVPSGLRHFKALTELKLTNMPQEFATTIAITKGQIWDDISHSPAIITDGW